MSLRIAHFVQRYPPALGGSEAYFARLGRYLVQGGDSVTVFTTTANALAAFWSSRATTFEAGASIDDGVEVRRFPLSLRMRGRRWLLKPLSLLPHRSWQCLTISCNPFAWGMWQAAGHRHEQFDIVHATAFPYAFPILCARRLARRLNVPFFLTPFLHLGDPLNQRDRTRRAYTSPALLSLAREADVVFAQTPTEREALIQHGVMPEGVIAQGLGVDIAACTGGDRRCARQAWAVDAAEVVIGHLANSSEEKGTFDLLKAAESLWQAGMAFRVVLAGPEMPSFHQFWKTYRCAHRVTRLGPLTDGQKRDFFAGIDIFALPSRSDSFGLVLLEAWANRLPNVAYRAGGIVDVVRDTADGLLAPCGNVAALTRDLARLISDAGLRRRLGANGRERLEREFKWEDKLAVVRDAQMDHSGRRSRACC